MCLCLTLWSTFISLNYPCLEHILMVSNKFEPLKIYCVYFNSRFYFGMVMLSMEAKKKSQKLFAFVTRIPQMAVSCLSKYYHETELNQWMDGWLVVLRPFNSISVMSGWLMGNNERLCAMEPVYDWKDFCLKWVLNLGLLDQQASA